MANPYLIVHGANTTAICVHCDKEFRLPVSTEQVRRWQQGELIQNAMPDLPLSDRELFVSGTCGGCWRKIFGTPAR